MIRPGAIGAGHARRLGRSVILSLVAILAPALSPAKSVEGFVGGVEVDAVGVARADAEGVQELTLVPSYWSTPFVFSSTRGAGKTLIVFGCRPQVESVAPGAEAPDSLMNRSCATRNSRCVMCLRVSLRFGSDIIGFSPMMYNARTPPSCG